MKTVRLLAGAAIFVALAACGETSVSADEQTATPEAAPASAPEAVEAAATAETAAPESVEAATPEVDLAQAPSGAYQTDPNHHYITFTYSHMGYSHPQVRWRDWSGALDWNAEDPGASAISVKINAASVDSGVDEFNGHLQDERFFDVANHPEITFVSTSIERTGPSTAKVAGDLTIRGVTLPVTLDAVVNRAADDDFAKAYKLGFSGKTTVKRSDFGMDAYVPYVSDEVEIAIEAEFVMPRAEE